MHGDSQSISAKCRSSLTIFNYHCRRMAVSMGINTACHPDAKSRVVLLIMLRLSSAYVCFDFTRLFRP